jgi:hypothetical protein
MGTYFKELDDRDEATLLYNQMKMLLGFISVVISSEYLYAFISGAEGGALYMADLLALLAVGCILIREGLRQTLALVEFYGL